MKKITKSELKRLIKEEVSGTEVLEQLDQVLDLLNSARAAIDVDQDSDDAYQDILAASEIVKTAYALIRRKIFVLR
ncbi:MAG TPA: hypothetical protein EYG51_08200 [Pseudomonadales bacterium]|nr:hypothetical protein [Pseudomonadales bacterium]